VHAPSEGKSGNSKDSFYEDLEQVFDHFSKYHMKILIGDFNAKVGRENVFKLTIGNESLHQDSNDNGVRIVNFAKSKNLVFKSRSAFFHQTALPEYMVRIANNKEHKASPKLANMKTQPSTPTSQLSVGLQNIKNTNKISRVTIFPGL